MRMRTTTRTARATRATRAARTAWGCRHESPPARVLPRREGRSLASHRFLPVAVLATACILALAGCEAAEREPEALQDTALEDAEIQDPTVPGEGAVVGEPETPGATPTAGADTVDVTLVDYEIQMPDRIAPGAVTFRIVNEGSVLHGFEVEGQGQEWAVEEIEPGATSHLQANLTAGSWEVYCPVGNHAEGRGMETTLQVESAS